MIQRAAFAIALACLTASTPAYACIDIAKFNIEDIRQADVVVSGVLSDYEIVEVGNGGPIHDYAILTVKVDGTLKGTAPKTLRLSWDNSTFAEPEGMNVGSRILVAGSDPESTHLPVRGPSATVFSAPRGDMFRLLQAPCSDAFLFAYTPDLESDLRAILAGNPVRAVRYSDAQWNLFDGPSARKRRDWDARLILASSLAGLGGLTLAVIMLVRNRKKKRQAAN